MYDQITKNFNTREGRCLGKDCCNHSSPVTPEVWYALQEFRDALCKFFKRDIVLDLTNGYRCQKHNKSLSKSKPTSQHCRGLAVDILIPEGVNPEVFMSIAKNYFKGVGLYKGFLHVDLRVGRRATWRN